MDQTTKAIKRSMWLVAIVTCLALAVVVKLVIIQFVEGPSLRDLAEETTVTYRDIPAARGNIYTQDGALLATTMPLYSVHMDVSTVEESLFEAEYKNLARGLASIFKDRSYDYYTRYLNGNRSHRYLLIRRKVNYRQLQEIKDLPIFNKGRFKGGLVVEQVNSLSLIHI